MKKLDSKFISFTEDKKPFHFVVIDRLLNLCRVWTDGYSHVSGTPTEVHVQSYRISNNIESRPPLILFISIADIDS